VVVRPRQLCCKEDHGRLDETAQSQAHSVAPGTSEHILHITTIVVVVVVVVVVV